MIGCIDMERNDMIKIIQGNALEVMEDMPETELFDAVISDPPYSSGAATMNGLAKSTAEKYTTTKKNCPFPDFEGDTMDKRSWGNMMMRVLRLAREHTRLGGVLVLFVDWRQYPILTDVLQWSGWTWRGVAVWDKGGGCRPQRGRFKQQAEYIVWGSNGALPIDRPVPCLPGVYTIPNVQGAQRIHQTQKPLELMRQIVRICVPKGRILDMFCGSGTTLLAADMEGYDALGIELSKAIRDSAVQRLERH